MYTLWQAHNEQQVTLNEYDQYNFPDVNGVLGLARPSLTCVTGQGQTRISRILTFEETNTELRQSVFSISSTISKNVTFDFTGQTGVTYQFNNGDITSDTINGSQTITHKTEGYGDLTPGLFCESTGEIYYMKPREKSDGEIIPWCAFEDAICKIKKAESLNKNIVGIITHVDNEFVRFATHGDILIRVIPGSYSLGDIIVPTNGGLGKKATSEEIMNCITLGIPRVKVTATTTKFSDCVAGMIL